MDFHNSPALKYRTCIPWIMQINR